MAALIDRGSSFAGSLGLLSRLRWWRGPGPFPSRVRSRRRQARAEPSALWAVWKALCPYLRTGSRLLVGMLVDFHFYLRRRHFGATAAKTPASFFVIVLPGLNVAAWRYRLADARLQRAVRRPRQPSGVPAAGSAARPPCSSTAILAPRPSRPPGCCES